MPLIYFHQPDELGQQSVTFHPEEDYWQHRIPISKGMWPSSTGGDPATAGIADEDFWQPLVAPAQATLVWPQQFLFEQNEIVGPPPALHLDEDFWINPVQPAMAALRALQPFTFEQDDLVPFVAPTFTPDEDLWNSPHPANYFDTFKCPAPWIYGYESNAGGLVGQPDEDFWINPVAPVPFTLWRNPIDLYGTPDEIPTQAPGVPEEDFWINPVRPVVASMYQPLPYWFDQAEMFLHSVFTAGFINWIQEDDS